MSPSVAVAAIVCATLCLAGASQAAADATTIYVSPQGNDHWSGRLAAPNAAGTDGPLATLEGTRAAVRKAVQIARPVKVVLRGGTYRLRKPFVLGPRESGTDIDPVIYCGYHDEKPVISGGMPVTGWKRQDGDIWVADVPAVKAGEVYFRQLFVNGQRRDRARLPHNGWTTVVGSADTKTSNWAGNIEAKPGDDLSLRSFTFKPGDIRPDWTNLDDVEIVVLQYWMAARLRIQALDADRNTALFTGGSWRPLTWSFGYYADNVFEGIDQPGSWYLNRKTGTLYYHALPGEDMTQAEAIAPVCEQLLRIEGGVAMNEVVRGIWLSGLTFEHTSWDLPPKGYAFSQAELPAPSAIQATGACDCRIDNCTLSHLGGWGIELGRGCQDNVIEFNHINDVGAGCIKIGEPDDPGSDAAEACRITVSDNRLADGCKVYLGSPAVWVGQSGHNTISYNEISGQFVWAVSLGWNWSYFPLNRSRDNIVEKNHIHDLGTGTLGTHGALYCLGVSPGTVLRNNYIHDVGATAAWGAGEGIILDNGCVGILVENNIVHDAASGGWGCNFNCLGSLIINNIFVNGRRYQLTRYGDAPQGPPPPNGEVFSRNIVVWKEGPLFNEKDWWSFATLWDYNLYYQSAGEPVKFMHYSFDEWKAKGLDRDSIIADPLFVDPAKHDYRLRPDSPAYRLGFRPIDISDVGPRYTH
jgi:hypothetical protein